KMIEQYLKKEHSFLDVGTGSGILMIAAAKLGAKHVIGIDNDEVAIPIADQNLKNNNIRSDRFHVGLNTLEKLDNTGFDIICANILAHVIIDILPEIKSRLNIGGIAILSGIIKEKQESVLLGISQNDLELVKIEYQEEWVAISVKKST
ncbi:MAG: methyltransferase domain-containing protein, partial [Desulfobacteraceae bacterium]|nr:methyltransferase domain-containing protein [Desulfobacteraceae bacterium]